MSATMNRSRIDAVGVDTLECNTWTGLPSSGRRGDGASR